MSVKPNTIILDCWFAVVMLEAPYNNKGLVNSCFNQNLNISIKPKEFPSFWSIGSMSSTLNPNLIRIRIGIRCSGTKKCSQKYEINHFCLGIFSAI